MAWTGQSFSVGQILTAAQMTNLQNDITAAFNKDSSAPVLANDYVVNAMIGTGAVNTDSIANNAVEQNELAANAVGQSELKSTTANQSVVMSQYVYYEIAPTGDSYTMGWFLGSNVTVPSGTNRLYILANNDNSYTAKVGLVSENSSASTAYLFSRYVQASPPYDLGDGEIPLFVYALIDNASGEIVGTSAAKDPHWAYHGNHNIIPDGHDKEKGINFKYVPKFILDGFDINAAIKSRDIVKRNIALDYLHNKKLVKMELTNKYKNQDMNIAPHPFPNYNPLNQTVVLLDPVSNFVIDLYELHKQNEIDGENNESISTLLNKGFITLDNKSLNRNMPNNVIAVTPSWKNTK